MTLSDPAQFLAALWGDHPPGLIPLWRMADKTSLYLHSPLGAAGLTGAADVFVGVATTARDRGRRGRVKAHETAALAGMWLDVDINGGPDGKHGAAPTLDHALALVERVVVPTIVVNSGYGLHAWWLLDEPWIFANSYDRGLAAQAAHQWQALHDAIAYYQGWTVDHTHDLARVLRLPGTCNTKGGLSAPVTVLDATGPRYRRSEILDLAATAGPVATTPCAGQNTAATVTVTARDDAAAPAKLDALVYNSPEFAAALAHRGHGDDWSLSQWDLSLASQAANAGWTNQEIADLITWHRRTHAHMTQKRGTSAYYLKVTIGKARERTDREQASSALAEIARTA